MAQKLFPVPPGLCCHLGQEHPGAAVAFYQDPVPARFNPFYIPDFFQGGQHGNIDRDFSQVFFDTGGKRSS
mgnify:CR=1 FL=1